VIQHSRGEPATTAAVEVDAKTSSGHAVTHFSSPLELSFPGAPGNIIPAYSRTGISWTAIPLLASPTLPPGLDDGYYRDNLGTLHILTRHATEYGLVVSGTSLKPVPEPLALGYTVNPRVVIGHPLTLTLTATRPAKIEIVLRKTSRTVTTWHRTVGTTPTDLTLALPTRVQPGSYNVELTASAGTSRVVHSVVLGLVKAAR
jgi:hypothetical protein